MEKLKIKINKYLSLFTLMPISNDYSKYTCCLPCTIISYTLCFVSGTVCFIFAGIYYAGKYIVDLTIGLDNTKSNTSDI